MSKEQRNLTCKTCGKIVRVGEYKGGDPDYYCGGHREEKK